MTLRRRLSTTTLLALSLVATAGLAAQGCGDKGGYRGGKKSKARQWLDEPSGGEKTGNKIIFSQLDLTFEIPDTLYVFKNCDEASATRPRARRSGSRSSLRLAGGAAADPDGVGEPAADSDAIALTFYLAPKGRPIDERAVAYYTNEYKEAGLKVEELAFNDDYFYKTGIYAKLQVMDESGTNAVREIQQFMWPVRDVVFVARMEYPYGDTRAIAQDWKAIMPYFKTAADDKPAAE
jgi:hypothetical protein